MWTWQQTGRLLDPQGIFVSLGYSGSPAGRNRPEVQAIHNFGPIPQGRWKIVGPPYNHPTRGPCVLRLEPHWDTEVFGRGGFLIHGDSIKNPGSASLGCIILPRWARQQIWESEDHELFVTSGQEPREVTT